MARRTRLTGPLALALASTLVAAACTTSKSKAPELSGPSELGLSVTLSANPDTLTKDGSSQSVILITTRNAEGQPAGGIGMRVETWVGGVLVDYGRLSTKSVVTGSDGRAQVIYTAPEGPATGDQDEVVRISVVPSGTDFSNAFARDVLIRLAPQGQVLPPSGQPVAKFTFAPSSPTQGQDIAFDASTSTDFDGTRNGLSYAWDFGDGSRAEGMQVRHAYNTSGSYNVTLTVSNQRGYSNRTSSFVNVGVVAKPTAGFTASPTSPEVGQSVFFNAALSTAAPGHTIVGYDWTFGDGGRGSGQTVSHKFDKPGSYVVTLTVTDDVGNTAATSQTIATATTTTGPTADFVVSPGSPLVNQPVNFDARTSTAPAGRTLTGFDWNFGDGTRGSGERPSHVYTRTGSYSVTLTVTDSAGVSKSVVKTVDIR